MSAIRSLRAGDDAHIVALWEEAGLTRPWNDPRADIARARAVDPELFLVAVDGDKIIGTVMAGYDGHRGWLYYLAVDRAHRRRGVGAALVREAEARLLERGCPKVQLMVRPENTGVHGFYAALGYEPFETWATGKRLIDDAR